MTSSTIAAGYPRALLEFAVSQGADRNRLLEACGLQEEKLRQPDNRVALEKYLALFEEGAAQTRNPALALEFGKAVRMQEISIVGLICEACSVAWEVGPALNRYARLVFDGEEGVEPALIRAHPTSEGIWIEQPNPVFARTPYLAESELARLVWNTRLMFAGSPNFQAMVYPRAVSFVHEAPRYKAAYDKIFDAPVVFAAERTAILVEHGFPMLRQPPTNRYVFEVLLERAEHLLEELQQSKTLRGKVESILLRVLHTGDTGIDAAARQLGVTRQTLSRRLKAEGTTYESLLSELRLRLATEFLSARKTSVNEIAYLLGFSDPAAFSRAFKRWTGKSPRDWKLSQ